MWTIFASTLVGLLLGSAIGGEFSLFGAIAGALVGGYFLPEPTARGDEPPADGAAPAPA